MSHVISWLFDELRLGYRVYHYIFKDETDNCDYTCLSTHRKKKDAKICLTCLSPQLCDDVFKKVASDPVNCDKPLVGRIVFCMNTAFGKVLSITRDLILLNNGFWLTENCSCCPVFFCWQLLAEEI